MHAFKLIVALYVVVVHYRPDQGYNPSNKGPTQENVKKYARGFLRMAFSCSDNSWNEIYQCDNRYYNKHSGYSWRQKWHCITIKHSNPPLRISTQQKSAPTKGQRTEKCCPGCRQTNFLHSASMQNRACIFTER